MIRLMLEKNTPVGKSECKTFIKKLKTHNSIKFRMHYIYRDLNFIEKLLPASNSENISKAVNYSNLE